MRFFFEKKFVLFALTILVRVFQPTLLDAQGSFPKDWEGIWSGELQIYNAKGKAQGVTMTLEILPIPGHPEGRYTFGLVYGDKSQDWRPYELVPVAPERGLWKVDEKNSIELESYLIGPKLLCWFTVQDVRTLCAYEKISPDELTFEVVSGMEKPVSQTGGVQHEDQEIPQVNAFPFSVFQRAVLKRQN
ncbi:MAG: hypothetical protein ACK4NS_01965 [Saprospiraceae bacterium]